MIDVLVLVCFFALAILSVPLAIVIGTTALVALGFLTNAPPSGDDQTYVPRRGHHRANGHSPVYSGR